ncbi:MAG TPA: nickel-dependent hydrogenase large subunit, partial [Negativicutes bacterium]|nr:nickel-dependent hydrogenase large subunit [Negativicutes bacterium]
MSRRIIINPVTRISGFMEIEVFIENKRVVEAKTSGLLFRGFEKMLVGRNPFDAVYFTERICGICSTAHSIASSMALESALKVIPSEQGRYLRDIIHGCEFLQNHIRHFYQYTVPDFVRLPEEYPIYRTDHKDYRLSKEKNDLLVKHYFDSLDMSRKAHEMLAVLGGKAPHNHGVFIGGITTQATADKVIKLRSILSEIKAFIENAMLSDVFILADYYPEYYHNGGGYGNLLTYGCFNGYNKLGTLYVDAATYSKDIIEGFNQANISEETEYSWYSGAEANEPDMEKPKAYTWIKAARYKGRPFETGPLARQWLSGEYRHGISTMDRTIARVMEARKITEILGILLANLEMNLVLQKSYSFNGPSQGSGLVDTTRGSLGHWIR